VLSRKSYKCESKVRTCERRLRQRLDGIFWPLPWRTPKVLISIFIGIVGLVRPYDSTKMVKDALRPSHCEGNGGEVETMARRRKEGVIDCSVVPMNRTMVEAIPATSLESEAVGRSRCLNPAGFPERSVSVDEPAFGRRERTFGVQTASRWARVMVMAARLDTANFKSIATVRRWSDQRFVTKS
jgi:hypothetical protein